MGDAGERIYPRVCDEQEGEAGEGGRGGRGKKIWVKVGRRERVSRG